MSARSLRPLFAAGFGLLLAAASPVIAQSPTSCKPVFDGIDKVLTMPTHMVRTVPRKDGEPTNDEAIYAGGAIYQKTGSSGKWEKNAATTAMAAKQEHEGRAKAKTSCRVLKSNDTVGMDPATLYEYKNESKTETSTAQVWISKAKGLILKQEIDVDAGDHGKVHYSVRYDYDNVQAPKH